jgi:cardiolipin synthase A/B
LIILFLFLLYIDYLWGKREHARKADNLIFPLTTGECKFYKSGATLFNDMFQQLKDAKKEILIEFFIVKKDRLGNQFLQLLKEKAAEGVVVRLLVDRLGSFWFTKKDRKMLEKSGVQFAFSEKPRFPFLFYRLNRRNHRKIVIIDGVIGYVGGFNVGDEYIGKNPTFNVWHDYHVCLSGKVVADLQRVFQLDWEKSAGPINVFKADEPVKGKKEMQVLATDGIGLEQFFIQYIHTAKEELIFGTPYFIPTEAIVAALKEALERGVQVYILVPMKADHLFVKEAGMGYYERLKQMGAKVRMYDIGFFHGKLFMMDKKLADIGTANFDRRSFYLNKEVNVVIFDRKFSEEVRKVFFKVFRESIEFSDHWLKQLNWKTKITIPIAKLLRPFL